MVQKQRAGDDVESLGNSIAYYVMDKKGHVGPSLKRAFPCIVHRDRAHVAAVDFKRDTTVVGPSLQPYRGVARTGREIEQTKGSS
jgi:hypothetical protein